MKAEKIENLKSKITGYMYSPASQEELQELFSEIDRLICPAETGDYKCHVRTNLKDSKNRDVFVDRCLKQLIEYLNKGGFKTVASCGGHGEKSSIISIVLDYKSKSS